METLRHDIDYLNRYRDPMAEAIEAGSVCAVACGLPGQEICLHVCVMDAADTDRTRTVLSDILSGCELELKGLSNGPRVIQFGRSRQLPVPVR